MESKRKAEPRARTKSHIAFRSRGWRWSVETENDEGGVELHIRMYRDAPLRSGLLSDEREFTVFRKSFGRCMVVANARLLLNEYERAQLRKLVGGPHD